MRYSAGSEILKIEDLAQLAWAAIDPIWSDLPYTRNIRVVKRFMNELTEGQRGLIALDWCQKEIRNGGFAQLFSNSTGILVPWAIDGFQMIDAEKYRRILSRAAEILGSPYPSSRWRRNWAMRWLGDHDWAEIGDLEKEFFGLIRSEEDDLETFRGRYVREHPDQFIAMESNG